MNSDISISKEFNSFRDQDGELSQLFGRRRKIDNEVSFTGFSGGMADFSLKVGHKFFDDSQAEADMAIALG